MIDIELYSIQLSVGYLSAWLLRTLGVGTRVANPVLRGLLDRKRAEEHVVYKTNCNESVKKQKTEISQQRLKNEQTRRKNHHKKKCLQR